MKSLLGVLLTSALFQITLGAPTDTSPQPKEGCLLNGVLYAVGEAFQDDCNTCICNANQLASCTKMYCLHHSTPLVDVVGDSSTLEPTTTPGADVGCEYNGQVYEKGGSYKADCNTCSCAGNNIAFCTLMACVAIG